jgi:hypothetical protein
MNSVSTLLAKAKELKLKIVYKPVTAAEIHYFERWLASKICIFQLLQELKEKDAQVKKRVNARVKTECEQCLKERDKLRKELKRLKGDPKK